MYAVIPSIADQELVGNLKRAQSIQEHIPKVKILKLKHWRGKCIQAIGYIYVSCDQLSSDLREDSNARPWMNLQASSRDEPVFPFSLLHPKHQPPLVARPHRRTAQQPRLAGVPSGRTEDHACAPSNSSRTAYRNPQISTPKRLDRHFY